MNDDIQTETTPANGDGILEQEQADVTLPTNDTTQATDWAAQLEALKQEAQTNLEGWQRARADFTNYKKRMERELSESREKTALDTLVKILPIVDDFERAVQNIPADLSQNPWVSGTALILKKFEKLLDEYQVTIIDPVGQPFDPHQHEAVGMDDPVEGIASGHVTVTLQKGYISGERVLRPALVRVAS
jgi:molecular chaperone GrpE